ncbi:MAG TPA: heterodisulfide reductase [Desulfosporosinus sp.]|nr:heterodisulfide reductase [Desulfosporosinus sp.]
MSQNKIGSVLIVGAGIAGIQAALDLAESGYLVHLVEESSAIGGTMPMLDKTFPTNDCSMCILSPKLVECGRHLNVRTYTNSQVVKTEGEAGNFKVTIKQKARYIDLEKCTGCGACAEACPVKVDDEFNQGLGKRKAAFKQYSQAFPNAYGIDEKNCLYQSRGKAKGKEICMKCVKACQAGAIDHHMEDKEFEVEVGSMILNPGFKIFDASSLDYYGYGKIKSVITSLEFERLLSASGPFDGHLVRPFDKKEPQRIAWIQCVGSRNAKIGNNYCSGVCCMYAIKEAVIAKEHSHIPVDTTIFYMDMRTPGKDFEKYYNNAKNQQGVNFIRSRVYEVTEATDDSGDAVIRYSTEDGQILSDQFDLVVLSVGLEPGDSSKELAKLLDLQVNKYGFAELEPLSGVNTSKEGIFAAGAFSGPRDIPETVMQASAAAGAASALLAEERGTLVSEKEYPPEMDVAGDVIRTGVFICHCGVNIGSVVNVPSVVEYAKTLPTVAYATDKIYACSQDAQASIKALISEQKLNRIVVSSCSPRTHEPLFQETLKEAGLNAHLFDMANIRDQCSWVHMNEPEKATEKAKDLTKLAIVRASMQQQTQPIFMDMNHAALVIGGGVAGMTSALSLADQGYEVHLVEKESALGGVARRFSTGFRGEDMKAFVAGLIEKVSNHSNVKLHVGVGIKDVGGFLGNFTTTLENGEQIAHGVALLTIGGQEYKPNEYLYGQDERVMTQIEMDEALYNHDAKVENAKNFVFIQCVGSRTEENPYCSRTCCTKSVKLALKVKKKNPGANVFVLYRDMRTYSYFEEDYEEARRIGIIFVRYSENAKPVVNKEGDTIVVTVTDHVLDRPLEIETDVLCLAAAIKAPADGKKLSKWFKIPLNADGFFLEAHMKLRPVDFSTDGVFMAGIAHSPKNMEEVIAQAKAAAGRAGVALSKDQVESAGLNAFVNKRKCTACGTCEAVCSAKAITVDKENRVAVVNDALCKGCGACASSCRCGALSLRGCTNEQIVEMLNSL